MSEDEVQDAEVTEEKVTRKKFIQVADQKFLLALTIISAYIVFIAIIIATNNSEMFSTVGTAMTGIVGTVIGYYFGAKTKEEG